MSTPHRVTPGFWDHATLWSDDDSEAGHTTDGGRVFGITRTRYVECDRYGCQPVVVIDSEDRVVIDPEDREQVERLAKAFLAEFPTFHKPTDAMQAALRSLLAPKPDEPTGLGAVVEDSAGDRWVRSHTQYRNGPWTRPHLDGCFAYDEIAVVRVLSEGVS